LLPTFVFGGRIVVIDAVDAENMCRLIASEGVTRAFPLLQFTMDEIVELNRGGRYDLSSLRSAGHTEAWNGMVRLDTARVNAGSMWGQTETTGPVTWAAIGPKAQGRFGRSTPFTMVRVFDEDGNEVAVGEVGELVVRGPVVASGYWNRPEINARGFGDGWRRSNDLGCREADGSITFIGPKTKMIKSGVENIYPAEVEGALKRHRAVKDAAIIGVPDEKWVQSVKAIVVLEDGTSVTPEELIDHCKSQIASYKKPRTVEFVDAIPRQGFAVDYDRLDDQFGGGGYPGGSTRSS
jgi:acyl-CoA synthetase (AMP-forming)/AMP-acid ligase II